MNYETIASYLAGELHGVRKQEVEIWIKHSQQNHQEYLRWQLIWKASENVNYANSPDVEEAWLKIKPTEDKIHLKSSTNEQKVSWKWLGQVAALLVLVAGLLFVINKSISNQVEWVENETKVSQTTELDLPDGTKVWLNHKSKIKFPKKFTSVNREVFLEGEAFFEVARREKQPFIIYSGTSITQVLGTSFNLRSYVNDSIIALTVLTGEVSFMLADQKQDAAVVLQAEQKANLNKRTNIISSSSNDNVNFLAWKTGKMSFKNTELKEALQVIESYYKVDFEANDSTLLNCRFTGTFDNAPLQEVLDVFSFGSDISPVKEGEQYILYGKGSN
jgi:ferric-dicitrate binding protein FerR (iron transport regulator)